MLRWTALIVLVIVIGLFAFTRLVAPPGQLNILNALTPGDSGVVRLVDGAVFDESSGLKLDVWAPKEQAKSKRPVLIFFYGGGWHSGRREHYAFAAKAYAAKGFVVVLPDYRKVPEVRFPTFNQDAAASARWVQDNIDKWGGDPKRVTLAGHSAGAYIAMILTLDPRYLRNAGVVPGFVRATVGLAGPYDFLPFDSVRSINAFGTWPKPVETQPIAFVSGKAPPIMVLTGTHDDTVKPRNAILLAKALREKGTQVVFKAYPDLDHEDLVMALSKPFRNKGSVLADSSMFLLENDRRE
jgi:acetyl esterase/lipase